MRIDSLLQKIPLFASLADEEITTLAKCMSPVKLKSGETLFHEGEKGTSLYIIVEGQLDIVKSLGRENEHLLQTWDAGNFIGEMSMFDRDGLRIAAARARTDVHLLEMSHFELDALLHRQPDLAFEVMRQLSLRLRDTDNAIIADLQAKNRQLANAYAELKTAQEQIIEKERLERELQVAREIQQSILPRVLPKLDKFDLGVCMVPARAVGGDLYNIIPLQDNKIAIVLGDVSDKGVPAAIFMALTSSLVHAEAHHANTPEEVLRNVNHLLLSMNDSGLFVTAIYGILDCQQGKFTYVRAGHEIPLGVSRDGTKLEISRGQGQAIGLFDDIVLETQILSLSAGEVVLLFSDGATDAVNSRGDFFGHENLLKSIKRHRELPAQGLCTAVLQEISDFQGDAQQADDIALVAIRGR